VKGFTKKYDIDRLVYYEETGDVDSAIVREKQIKSWRKRKKIDLVKSVNSTWSDLSEGWYEE
jgi:putative endonuclease